MFEHIGDVLPRFQAYETIFSSNPRLMQSLSNAYLDIAKFCTSVKTAFQKANKSGSYPYIHFTHSTKVRLLTSIWSGECKGALQTIVEIRRATIWNAYERLPKAQKVGGKRSRTGTSHRGRQGESSSASGAKAPRRTRLWYVILLLCWPHFIDSPGRG